MDQPDVIAQLHRLTSRVETLIERVRVLLSDTDLTPDSGPTTASRQTYVTSNAARHAAVTLHERLAHVAAEQWDVPPDTIRFVGGELRADGHSTPLKQCIQ